MTGSLLLAPARRQGHHHTTAGRDPIGGPPGSGKAIITPPWPVSNWWLARAKRGSYLLAGMKRARWAPVLPARPALACGQRLAHDGEMPRQGVRMPRQRRVLSAACLALAVLCAACTGPSNHGSHPPTTGHTDATI